ncbi:beta-1,3-glucan-binding protein-like [Physella acuta]|uniref:beta-1,3-glucan-binding protein-like n=1 Tax=Physella acuta TaxID=109671 RepID=UPI0027DC655B|nr:beta-1,3-glucan-binding protein-like [Physella acuta]XP_059163524.1 beta-1,3-glucan-binding protein-like [Physella acuta]XP_059163525.1 beta-1,3-glucan-binding protein-like [Physella acuta]XP_059163526.1 beta-1,3-glucan-binding protein-like [Physella acuta]XP_059163527.1 beta-1,3-glucan-binding protein-like [Physella acuta]XP_059163528.1 beta-1,3-glucan-binding protein-like [Physella acuta]
MLLYLLLSLTVCAVGAVDLTIRYNPPVVSLTLPVHQDNIKSVVFHILVKNVAYQGQGHRTTEGWQYQTRDLNLDGADALSAYAVVLGPHGTILQTTQRSTLKLETRSPLMTLSSGRRLRAVIFRDDFNTFDHSKWHYEVSMFGGFNGEFQVYTNDHKNVYARDGHLYLHPITTVSDPRFDENFLHTGHMDMNTLFGRCTQSGNNGCTRDGRNGFLPPIMSGKVKSVPTLRYGTIEVRAKIPRGDWLWPAIWMMPKGDHYGGWPRSGEIDIMESRGNAGDIGVGSVSSTLHWGPSADQNKYSLTHGEKKNANWHSNFHIWRLEWTHDHILTFIDNQLIMSVVPPAGGFWQKGGFTGSNLWASGSKMAPFDQEFFMMFNVAVGGNNGFFPDGNHYGGVTKPWSNSQNQHVAAENFWKAHNAWLPTWQGENAALIIDYIQFSSL